MMYELTLGDVVCRQPCAAWLVKRSKRDKSRMCGRYMVLSSPEAIRRLFGYPEQSNFPPRYNVAPTQPVPIVRIVEGQRQFALVRWGLIPPWVKDPRKFSLLINARGESVNDRAAFRYACADADASFPPMVSTPGRTKADANAPTACARGRGDRSLSPACGKPGWGRTARRWRRRSSSPPRPRGNSRACTSACR